MIHLDTRRIVDSLKTIESLAVIPRVASTNLIARRIVAECIENELSLPQAMIIAEEQTAGIGRNARSWSSPAGKGIYSTILLTRPASEQGDRSSSVVGDCTLSGTWVGIDDDGRALVRSGDEVMAISAGDLMMP